MTDTLRNGVPIRPQVGLYRWKTLPPQRVGDEAIIDVYGGERRVQLLRGTGRKRWLVEVRGLKRWLRAEARRKIAAL